MNLNEQMDLKIYKKLLEILSNYVEHFPQTPVTNLFEKCLNEGLKVIPKDQEKQEFLETVLWDYKDTPTIVQTILNKKLI